MCCFIDRHLSPNICTVWDTDQFLQPENVLLLSPILEETVKFREEILIYSKKNHTSEICKKEMCFESSSCMQKEGSAQPVLSIAHMQCCLNPMAVDNPVHKRFAGEVYTVVSQKSEPWRSGSICKAGKNRCLSRTRHNWGPFPERLFAFWFCGRSQFALTGKEIEPFLFEHFTQKSWLLGVGRTQGTSLTPYLWGTYFLWCLNGKPVWFTVFSALLTQRKWTLVTPAIEGQAERHLVLASWKRDYYFSIRGDFCWNEVLVNRLDAIC